MKSQVTQALSAAIVTLLRPLVRILLRNGIPYGAFADLVKRVYVDVATQEFAIDGRKQSKSRVSILTGLSRKEVPRVKRLPPPDDLGAAERYNRAARVLGGWVRDRRFADRDGDPAVLPTEGEGSCTFSELVRSYSGDAPARAILDELVRVGAVERLGRDWVRLVERAYIPKKGNVDKIGILGTDVADLISTIDHNILMPDAPFFHRKVCYDNLPAEALPELRLQVNGRAQMLLDALDRWMSEHDRDIHPQVAGTGRKRAGVGIYYFESDREAEDEP
jgi:hypothetical protein